MKIAVSACLLGEPCRYDSKSKACPEVIELQKHCEIVPICPEVLGGLPTPRVPSEIVPGEGESGPRVLNAEGADNTEAFMAGAQRALDIVLREGCNTAILKAKSPSCGSGHVYDGTFSKTLTPGDGITTRLFRKHRIRILDESQISLL